MSSPKTVSFNVNSYREMREITRILRGLTGSIVHIGGGKYTITYTRTETVPYYELKRRIEEAKEIAKKNIAYVDMYINKAKRDINLMRQTLNQEASKIERQIDAEIAKLEKLKQAASQKITSAYIEFDCSDDIAKIDQKINELLNDKRRLNEERSRYERALERYEEAVNDISLADEVPGVDALKPSPRFHMNTRVDSAKEIVDTVIEKIARGKKYAQELDKIAKVVRGGDLEKYDIRFVEKVKELDPFDPDSIKVVVDLLKKVIDDEKFLKQENANAKLADSAEQKVLRDLETLKQISENMQAIIAEAYEKDDLPDATQANEELLKEINNLILSLKELDYLSTETKQIIEQCSERLEENRNNISSGTYTALLKTEIESLTALSEKALKENEQYHEFIDELEQYNDLLMVLSPDDGEEDIDVLGPLVFDPTEAEEKIKAIKEANKFLRKAITDIHARAYIGTAISVLENDGDRVFKKEVTQEGMSCAFIRKDQFGVMFEMRTEDKGACLYPRGVILHNGKKLINPEQLREVHRSCDWAEEISEKMREVGFPSFKTEEREDEMKEDIYLEENYYHLSTYEESYRYLKMFDLTDEQIFELIGTNEAHEHKKQEDKSQESGQQKETEKEIKEGE